MSERIRNASEARLRSFVSRIERLDDEIADLNSDKSEVYKEAKGEGFDVPAMRELIAKRRKMAKDPAKFEEHREILEMYEAAMASGTRVATRARTTPPTSTPHDAETGEVLGDAPAPAAAEIGAAAYAEEPPSPSDPRSLADGAPLRTSPPACANPAAGQQFQGQSGMTATTPYRIERRDPAPAAPAEPQHEPIADPAARMAKARMAKARELAEMQGAEAAV